GDVLEYKWVVSDFSNTVESDVYEVLIESGVTVGYVEDFEGDVWPDGWESFGREDSWEGGVPTYVRGDAVSGENVYATTDDGDDAPDVWDSFGREDSWEWGVPTSGPGEASSGDNVYATNLDGDYAPIMDATLVMPAVTLPEGEAYLQFDQWHHFMGPTYPGEPSDYGYVVVSEDADMDEWDELARLEEKSDGWEKVEED